MLCGASQGSEDLLKIPIGHFTTVALFMTLIQEGSLKRVFITHILEADGLIKK